MATLIKNQIIKHLSKYAKNLNPDNISVDVLKGKGALHNVELNEILFTEILELPAWVSIRQIICNRISLKVPWTSLKTQPIVLFMDEVRVCIIMSSKMRTSRSSNTTAGSLSLSAYSNMDYTGYGWVNKVIEGIGLNINLLEISFSSEHFGGSFTLNQLNISSCSPFWQPISPNVDLHQTRLKDVGSNEVLIFKLVTWQLLRVEASNLTESLATAYNVNAPLRFITSQGRSRVTIKKSAITGAVLTGRIQIILNDLLWVATLSQLRSAISFYHYVLKLIQAASDRSRNENAEAVLNLGQESRQNLPGANRSLSASASDTKLNSAAPNSQINQAAVSPIFRQFDVVQSSYHLYVDCIDLHICDETNSETHYPDSWDFKSGALQATLTRLVCDFYPCHIIGGGRHNWVHYEESKSSGWIKQLLAHYLADFQKSKKFDAPSLSDLAPSQIWSKMVAMCCLVRLHDLKIHCVSETSPKNRALKKLPLFFEADREFLKLPGEPQPLITLEFVSCYYPVSLQEAPVPPGSTHIQINPFRIYLDLRTLRWMSFVYLDMCKTLGLDTSSIDWIPHTDVRMETIMSKVIVPLRRNANLTDYQNNNSEESECAIINVSSCVISNVLVNISDNCQPSAFGNYLEKLLEIGIFNGVFQTRCKKMKFSQIPLDNRALNLFLRHRILNFGGCPKKLPNFSLDFDDLGKWASNDVWCFELNPIWIDYAPETKNRPKNSSPIVKPLLIDTVFHGWSFLGNKSDQAIENADFYCFARPNNGVKFSLDRCQYLFLTRLSDQISRFSMLINEDSKVFYETLQPKSFIVQCLFSQLQIHLLLKVPKIIDFVESSCSSHNSSSSGSAASYRVESAVPTESLVNKVKSTNNSIKFDDQCDDSNAFESLSLTNSKESPPNQAISFAVEETVVEYGGHVTNMPSDQLAFAGLSDDATSLQTDQSDEDALLIGSHLSHNSTFADLSNASDDWRRQKSMFDDTFPSLNKRAANSSAADLAEEACEATFEREFSEKRANKHRLNDEAHVIVCTLPATQFLLTGYDEESYVTLQSPLIDLVEREGVQAVDQIYADLNIRNPKETILPFDGDPNDYAVKLNVISDGCSPVARLEGHIRNSVLNLCDEYAALLSDFFKQEPLPTQFAVDDPECKVNVDDPECKVNESSGDPQCKLEERLDETKCKPKESSYDPECNANESSDDPVCKVKESSDDPECKPIESSDDLERKLKESSHDPECKLTISSDCPKCKVEQSYYTCTPIRIALNDVDLKLCPKYEPNVPQQEPIVLRIEKATILQGFQAADSVAQSNSNSQIEANSDMASRISILQKENDLLKQRLLLFGQDPSSFL